MSLAWQPPTDAGVVLQYVVHFSMVEQSAATLTSFELDQQFNVTEPNAFIGNLKANKLYNFFVLASNDYGTSLPSSLLTINITKGENNKEKKHCRRVLIFILFIILQIGRIKISQRFLQHRKEYQLQVEAPIFLPFLGNHQCLYILLIGLVTSIFFCSGIVKTSVA